MLVNRAYIYIAQQIGTFVCILMLYYLLCCSAERAEREKAAKEKAEKERLEKEKERQQLQDRQERARILRESAQLAQDAVNQHFTESLRRVSNKTAKLTICSCV